MHNVNLTIYVVFIFGSATLANMQYMHIWRGMEVMIIFATIR